jgi:hypothetical protein
VELVAWVDKEDKDKDDAFDRFWNVLHPKKNVSRLLVYIQRSCMTIFRLQ